MKQRVNAILRSLMLDYPPLQVCEHDIREVYNLIKACYDRGGKLLICGNGEIGRAHV